jgi:hypothetical protein
MPCLDEAMTAWRVLPHSDRCPTCAAEIQWLRIASVKARTLNVMPCGHEFTIDWAASKDLIHVAL